MNSAKIVIRPAGPEDVGLVLRFVRELAEYERLADQARATEEDYRTSLFGERPAAEVLIAEFADEPVGFALFFQNFSTFVGRPGIFLEDLYVRPEARGRGIGKALLEELVRLAYERGCGRVEWAVLDWNEPAIKFYESLGARMMKDWRIFRLDRAAIEDIARKKSSRNGHER